MDTMASGAINGQAGESYLWARKSPYYFDKDKLLPGRLASPRPGFVL